MAANSSKIPPHPLAKLNSSLPKHYLMMQLQTQQLIFHKEVDSQNCTHSCTTHVFEEHTARILYTPMRQHLSAQNIQRHFING
jgi:hypothetical protein